MASQVNYNSLNREEEGGRRRRRERRRRNRKEEMGRKGKEKDRKPSLKIKLYRKINSEWTADLNVAIKFLKIQHRRKS